MSDILALNERILLEKLKNDQQSAFTLIFTKYNHELVKFSYSFTRDQAVAEDIVQEVFFKLWENRKSLEIQHSLRSFLLKSVQNRSLDSLRHAGINDKYVAFVTDHPLLSQNDTENYIFYTELEMNFSLALSRLPEQYAQIYRMSRIEHKKYQEIADSFGISVRTVEVFIARALSMLRKELKEFLLLILGLFQLILD